MSYPAHRDTGPRATPGSAPRPSAIRGILRQLCPRCRSGRMFLSSIFTGLPRMHPYCPECGLKFERETGYFLGAMYISYGLGLFVILVFAVVIWLLTRWRLDKVTIWSMILFLPLAPGLTFLSRVLWIYLDQSIDPEARD